MSPRTVALAVVALLSACDGEPGGLLEPVTPQLGELNPLADPQDEKMALELGAMLADAELPEGAYVPVSVRSTSGSEVVARLGPALCDDFTQPGRLYRCGQLSVRMADGHRVEDVLPLLEEIDGQWLSLLPPIVGGRVYIFSGSVPEAFQRLQAHPAVRAVETAHLRAAVTPERPGAFLASVLRTSTGAEESPSVLQISHGDSVFASYSQPDGTVLQAAGRVVRCVNFMIFCD